MENDRRPVLQEMFLALLLLIPVAVGVVLAALIVRNLLNRPCKTLPQFPSPSWFFGSFLSEILSPPGEAHQAMARLAEHKGAPGVILRGILSAPQLFPVHHDLVHHILSHDTIYPKPVFVHNIIARIVGDRGLLSLEGEDHRVMRRLIDPCFRRAAIKTMNAAFRKSSDDLCEWISARMTGAEPSCEVDVLDAFQRLALDVIGSVAFDFPFEAISNPLGSKREVYESWQRGTVFSRTRVLVDFFPFLRHVLKGSASVFSKAEAAKGEMEALMKRIIAARTARALSEDDGDLLSSLLQVRDDEGKPLSERDLIDQGLTFLLAGHASTTVTLTWALFLLDQRPEWTEALRKELDPLEGRSPEMDDKLPVLAAVIKEVMRLYPALPATAREAAADDNFKGMTVPKGTLILISMIALGRLESVYGSDAMEFRPDRWLDETDQDKLAVMTRSTIPFFGGRRICIGWTLALAEIRVVLAAVVTRFDFALRPDHKVQPQQTVTLEPKGGLPIIFKRRARA
jgi:cytochrome P450